VATGGGSGHAEVTRVEVGYFGATAVLSVLLWLLYRRGPAVQSGTPAAPSGARNSPAQLAPAASASRR
jgi:hypothetical protein